MLAAYAVQAELGDNSAHISGRGGSPDIPLEQYYSEQILTAMERGVLQQHVKILHRRFSGMSRVNAEKEYAHKPVLRFRGRLLFTLPTKLGTSL